MRSFAYIGILLCLAGVCAYPATYYVATNGLDSNPGTVGDPWLTITKAVSNAVAGDTCYIGSGEYSEFLTNSASGTDGNYISFIGTRGGSGEWLTVIDPGIALTNGWVAATEIGSGVFKQTTAFTVSELTIDNKRVAFVHTIADMTADIAAAYNTNLTTGADFLLLPSTAAFLSTGYADLITWWDGIEALWCANGTTCYLRLRDGSDPNGQDIHVSQGLYAIRNTGQSYILWRNVLVRNAWGGFYLTGTNTHHVLIESNYVSGGYKAIDLNTGARQNSIQYNAITSGFYGYENPGAWSTDNPSTTNIIRENLYLVAKHLMGAGTSHDMRIYLSSAGPSNIISGNTVYKGLGEGIYLSGSVSSPTSNTWIYGNTLSNITSLAFLISYGESDTRVYDNLILDCNLTFRCSHMDESGESYRLVYIYRNCSWQPGAAGNHFYFHFNNSDPSTYKPDYWIYHNSFSGGNGAIDISANVTGDGGMPGVRFLNNIISGTRYVPIDNSALTNASTVGVFDYNLITPPYPNYPTTNRCAWVRPNNINAANVVWDTNSIPTFTLTNGCPGINAGLDLTQTFQIDSTNNAALPSDSTIKYGSGWDIGAKEYQEGPVLRAENLRVTGSIQGR